MSTFLLVIPDTWILAVKLQGMVSKHTWPRLHLNLSLHNPMPRHYIPCVVSTAEKPANGLSYQDASGNPRDV